VEIAGALAIVTGGAAGIGRAIAIALARKGAEAVVIADLDEPGATDTVALVNEAGAIGHRFNLDVTTPPELAQLFADVEHRFGPPNIVVNNAGIVSGSPGWPDSSLARLGRVIETNLGAVVLGTRLAVEHMRGRGGVIVNVAGAVEPGAAEHDPVYAATSAGIAAFSRSCAALHDQLGIRVNAVAPGLVDTALLAKTGDGVERSAWMDRRCGELRLLRPSEVADSVVALIEHEASVGEVVELRNERFDGAPIAR